MYTDESTDREHPPSEASKALELPQNASNAGMHHSYLGGLLVAARGKISGGRGPGSTWT